MTLRVVLYCPDRHMAYDGRTPDEIGVGGGVTARVRMARALARMGHDITHVVNCPRRETIDGVDYRPLSDPGRLRVDVAVFNTSGGALDLSPVLDLDLDARLRIVWVHGTQPPAGLGRLQYDALYSVSNFLARIVVSEWGIPACKMFVTHNGYDPLLFAEAERIRPLRDPYQLVYFSHPSKGLDTAIEVVRELRRTEPRFHLEIAGGARLWGGIEEERLYGEGVHDHGLLGQRAITALLVRSSYALQLQDREEPFGLSVVEAMRAGAVVIASPVGAIPEVIRNGRNGVLIPGDHRSRSAREVAVRSILWLSERGEVRNELLESSRLTAPSCDLLAQSWSQHWDALIHGHTPGEALCFHCGSSTWALADGVHCRECGTYESRGAMGLGEGWEDGPIG